MEVRLKNSQSYLKNTLNINILNEYEDVTNDINEMIEYHYIAQLNNGSFAHVILQESSMNYDMVDVILFKDSEMWFREIKIEDIKALSSFPKIFAEDTEKEVLKEKEYSFNVEFLIKKCGWEKLCSVVGLNEWAISEGRLDKSENIYLTETQCEKLNLL